MSLCSQASPHSPPDNSTDVIEFSQFDAVDFVCAVVYGVTMHTRLKPIVLTLLVVAVCILPLIASAAVRRTTDVCLQVVWLYFVTGSRG
jgi:hypothetical protein